MQGLAAKKPARSNRTNGRVQWRRTDARVKAVARVEMRSNALLSNTEDTLHFYIPSVANSSLRCAIPPSIDS
jgi:hypothetical protein